MCVEAQAHARPKSRAMDSYHLGRVPVRGHGELAGKGASANSLDPAVQRDHLCDRGAGSADDDLFTVLNTVNDPREVCLRVVNGELRSCLRHDGPP
jgi:hypothetical protein